LSQVFIEKLKGINDPSISWDKIVFPFTTAIEQHDFLNENNSYVRAYRIFNNDVIAGLVYRQDNLGNPTIPMDPGDIEVQEGWVSFIQVTPNAVSGNGILEVDLVPREMAQKKLQKGELPR